MCRMVPCDNLYGSIWLLVQYHTMHRTDPSYGTVRHTVPYDDVSYGTVWCIILYHTMHHMVLYDVSYGTVQWCAVWYHMMSHMDTIWWVIWTPYYVSYGTIWCVICYGTTHCTVVYDSSYGTTWCLVHNSTVHCIYGLDRTYSPDADEWWLDGILLAGCGLDGSPGMVSY